MDGEPRKIKNGLSTPDSRRACHAKFWSKDKDNDNDNDNDNDYMAFKDLEHTLLIQHSKHLGQPALEQKTMVY
jgi:hypothetical protein